MQLITSLDIGNEEIKVIVASAFDNKCNVLASTSIFHHYTIKFLSLKEFLELFC